MAKLSRKLVPFIAQKRRVLKFCANFMSKILPLQGPTENRIYFRIISIEPVGIVLNAKNRNYAASVAARRRVKNNVNTVV
jgi:hypothetical protein